MSKTAHRSGWADAPATQPSDKGLARVLAAVRDDPVGCPSRADLRITLGYRSPNAVTWYVRELLARKYLREDRTARTRGLPIGLTVTRSGAAWLKQWEKAHAKD